MTFMSRRGSKHDPHLRLIRPQAGTRRLGEIEVWSRVGGTDVLDRRASSTDVPPTTEAKCDRRPKGRRQLRVVDTRTVRAASK
jgi:hypothetical protein